MEEFLFDLALRRSSSPAAFASQQENHDRALSDPVRQAANRGWQIFPISPLARLKGNPDLLIGEATNVVARLEELAAEYPLCGWRVAVGPSSLCILELDGPQGRGSFSALSQEQGECLTLQARRGDTTLAFFRHPKGLVLRKSAKKLATGVRMLGPGDSGAIPPSFGSFYVNPWADVEAVPCWLRELAFETPDTPPRNAVPMPATSPRQASCRLLTPFERPHRGIRKRYPISGQAGSRKGYRISCRR